MLWKISETRRIPRYILDIVHMYEVILFPSESEPTIRHVEDKIATFSGVFQFDGDIGHHIS